MIKLIYILLLLSHVHRSISFLHVHKILLQKTKSMLYNQLSDDELPDGFTIDKKLTTRPSKPKQPISVSQITQLKELIHKGYRVEDLDVRGDTSRNYNDTHPVVTVLHRRKEMKVSCYHTIVLY